MESKKSKNPTKNAKHIISSIFANPAYAKLGKIFCTHSSLERLKAMLPLPMQENLLHISYKPPKLLFCFSHPSFSSEFNRYKAKDIISCLHSYKDDFGEISLEKLEVRGYVSKELLAKESSTSAQANQNLLAQCYKEHSKGEFINHASDKDLHDQIEQIRQLILKLQD